MTPDQQLKRLTAKDGRRRLREAIQRFTVLDGLRCCGARPTADVIGLHVGDGAARYSGLQSCHSVWSCPVCQARIRAARAVELERAALAWLRAGHGLYMATLTVPHWEHVVLGDRVKEGNRCAGQRSCRCRCDCPLLARAAGARREPCTCHCPTTPGQLSRIVEAWRGIAAGTWWAGRDVIRGGAPAPWTLEHEGDDRYLRRQEHGADGRPTGPATVWQAGWRERHHIAGMTRTVEITYGARGWHTHLHVLIWTETEGTEEHGEQLQRELYRRWAQRCRAVGLPTPDPIRGVRVDAAHRTRDGAAGGALAKYIVKLQDGAALGMEMTRTDLKVARGEKGLTALQLAALAAGGDRHALALWTEYELATRGTQCLTWSRDLRDRLAELVELDEREDHEIPEEEVAVTPELPQLVLARTAWRERIVPVLGARSDILHAAEVGGLPGAIAVLDKLGLEHGADWWHPTEPAPEIRPVDPAASQRGIEQAAARRRRREEIDRAVTDRTPQQWARLAQARVEQMAADAADDAEEELSPAARRARTAAAAAEHAAALAPAGAPACPGCGRPPTGLTVDGHHYGCHPATLAEWDDMEAAHPDLAH